MIFMHKFQDLIKGFERFKKKVTNSKTADFQALARDGQSPTALVVGCCDSRVDPALIMGCDPGDLFVVRNVANLVPPHSYERSYASTSAALEFGLLSLDIPTIIVLGHSRCAGIAAVLDKAGHKSDSSTSSIDQWMSNAAAAAEETIKESGELSIEEQRCICSRKSLVKSLENLQTYPWVKERLATGKVNIRGWYINITDLTLEQYCEESQTFSMLKYDQAGR